MSCSAACPPWAPTSRSTVSASQSSAYCEKKTQITNYAPPDDMTAFIPFTTLSGMIDTHYLQDIVLLPVSNQFRDRIVTDVRAALARGHNFNVNDTRAVMIIEWNKFLAIITNVSLGLKILLTIIGTFTLSIGAVGVVNIMLVSVTERTREIGVLKALGARRRHILLQILIEGLVLTFSWRVARLRARRPAGQIDRHAPVSGPAV